MLEGQVAFEPEVTNVSNGHSHKLATRNWTTVRSGSFHKVLNIGDTPAFYMYTYYNSSEVYDEANPKPKLPIGSELLRRFQNMLKFAVIVFKGVTKSLFRFTECQ